MNFGACPYCDGFMGMFVTPDNTPVYTIVQCESCGRDVWYKLSRIDPMAWTVEGFLEEFDVDEDSMTIRPKEVSND